MDNKENIEEELNNYIKRMAKSRNITEEEAEKHYLVKEYALMLRIRNGGKA